MAQVVVVGGGISGLAFAYRLRQRLETAHVTILEQNTRLGGTVWTERRDGFQVEAGPNGFLDSKPTTLQLCRDLELEGQLVPASEAASRNRYLFLGGRLRRLPTGLGDFFRSDLLSWRGKLRLLLERFQPRRRGDDDESIDAFARRRAGGEVAEVLADALVTGIHAGDPQLLSLAACFPRVAALEAEHGSILKGMAVAARQRRREAQARGVPDQRPGRLWSLRSGLRSLVEALHDRLRASVCLGVRVRRIERQDTGWRVCGDGNDRWDADGVVLACPAYQQAAMVADLDGELAEEIGRIAYNRIAVVAVGFRAADLPRPLEGFGYIAPQRSRRDVLGVQWCSSTFPDRAPPGCVLLRAMLGGWHRAEVVDWDDVRLLAAVRADLRQAL
ncbi:MAG: protoporphyrinogen oxidase, partial [Gemmataceae bacterium]|nr:protoporphyrinogen oxidase [Gemmataceae bacterium]MDW8266039.1 protoporphyrinogen oxidase [Gemmataceae bacterium]